MPRVTADLGHPVFTFTPDNEPMTPHKDTDQAAAQPVRSIDPRRVLESLVYELEVLVHEAPLGSGSDLIQLHGALLAYNLEGRADLMPIPSFGWSARSWRERRVIQAARRIVEQGSGDAAATIGIAADHIARLLHLIDPELAALAA
jgi:hypothetical protein